MDAPDYMHPTLMRVAELITHGDSSVTVDLSPFEPEFVVLQSDIFGHLATLVWLMSRGQVALKHADPALFSASGPKGTMYLVRCAPNDAVDQVRVHKSDMTLILIAPTSDGLRIGVTPAAPTDSGQKRQQAVTIEEIEVANTQAVQQTRAFLDSLAASLLARLNDADDELTKNVRTILSGNRSLLDVVYCANLLGVSLVPMLIERNSAVIRNAGQ